MAYPKKYRERVMEYISEGHTQEEAREIFKGSTTAIKGWKKLIAETGSLEKRELHRKARKYHPDKITAILEEQPDAYLGEIAEKFENGTISGIQTVLRRMKITRKKRRKSSKNVTKKNAENIKRK